MHQTLAGKKVVAVGGRIYLSSDWKSFPDFLNQYLKEVMGKEWWEKEGRCPADKRHPIMRWAFEKQEYFKRFEKRMGVLAQIKPNGPTMAYHALAYDLYLLGDNSKLQKSLIERLKLRELFDGARYEAMVASIFLRAGLGFNYEDESDNSRKHPEFVSVDEVNGTFLEVEAKSRNREHPQVSEDKIRLGIDNLLRNALTKFSGRPYVIFINLNVPWLSLDFRDTVWFKEILNSLEKPWIRNKEGKDIFSALIFTNFPVEYSDDRPPVLQNYLIYSQNAVAPLNMRTFNRISSAVNKYIKIPNSFDE